MQVYFSHPTFTFKTDTEELCIEMIDDYFDDLDEVINPADYGLRDDLREFIRSSDKVVGMSVGGKYTFLVHNEMEEGRDEGADLYTIRVESKEKIGEIEEGMPEDIRKLSVEESDKFSNRIIEENRETFWSFLFGKHGSRF